MQNENTIKVIKCGDNYAKKKALIHLKISSKYLYY